jgi:hypothetical protein
LETALTQARRHLALVQTERAQAEAAAEILERWAQGDFQGRSAKPLTIGQAARLLALSTDTLRHWERDGLLAVPRDPDNGYRRYGPAEVDRLRIIRLRLTHLERLRDDTVWLRYEVVK